MKIKPLFDRVVLTQANLPKTTASGLVLPETSQEKPLIGEVVAVGDGIISKDNTQQMIVKKGDKVMFSKYAGNQFKLEQKEFIIIRQSDILALLDE